MNQELLEILRKEVKPALGCTGPIGVCFGAAQAYDAIGGEIKRIVAKIDWGMASKIDDVAFPGTEMLGVEMAIALGAVCGDPKAGLEVLHNVTPEGEQKARKVAELVEVHPMWERKDMNIYIDITIETDRGTGRSVTAERSDGLILKERNGEVIEQYEKDKGAQDAASPMLKYKVKDFYEFATTTPIEEFDLLLKAAELNTELANETITRNLGAGIGTALYNSQDGNLITKAKAYAAAGCEARMSGVNRPAMSCANKGNVGIAASMPIVVQARELGLGDEAMQRGIALSYCLAIAIIHRIGKDPSMCSCEVAAAIGVAAGTVLLHGGTQQQVENAIQNTIPNIFGVVCDGAKLACALRISSGTGIGIEAANLALAGVRLANNQGVLAANADESINMIGHTALYAMVDSDRELSRQIFAKRKPFPLMRFEDRQKQ
ncbi:MULTISPECIES: L-serine ammonia-lyase, iron-sulfur-dependent, subunit alpha [Enterocloster]|uniref:L-cysteine desulfidase n=2 Tax=Enterocloster lavalensis TaxID=460384 RepID=A0A1I0IQ47_9FIRM|nr:MULTISPECIES: L-serine ammonia-lyase, iron-sulfur-dependent, subunit alpha [Enterocloster]MDR3757516.1 L-serine ammonia-lyase, iron-sulfur-dependent, subunit alpha [Enterocloster sp.]SET99221.1 L-cysteine desulfidase [Enterocloster lavalensis]